MAVKWGRDPKAGNVIIVGQCGYWAYTLWKILTGTSKDEIADKCFREYSVLPKDDTSFLICFREHKGKRFLHIAPEAAIQIEG